MITHKHVIEAIESYYEGGVIEYGKGWGGVNIDSPMKLLEPQKPFLNFKMQATNYPVSLPDSYVHFGKHKVFNRLLNKFDKHDLVRLWSLILNCKQVLEEEIEGDFEAFTKATLRLYWLK